VRWLSTKGFDSGSDMITLGDYKLLRDAVLGECEVLESPADTYKSLVVFATDDHADAQGNKYNDIVRLPH
jgi:hypothetical protein